MLKKAWETWKAFARKVGDFQTRIVLTLFYFVVVAPFGLALRAFSDPLRVKRPASSREPLPETSSSPWPEGSVETRDEGLSRATASFWLPREPREANLEEAGRQF